MKTKIQLLFLLHFMLNVSAQQIPYHLVPDWESTPLNHVATGLCLADINGDGWKDLIVANGNDISRQNLVVYYNNGGGTFPLTPSFSSADIDFHGQCAAGDINGDGWMDVAVSVYIGAAGFPEPGKVKVYYNTGGQLEPTPSFESENFYTFSCALGDADADGDLDLAVATSESYGSLWDYGRIFYNHNGSFNSQYEWQSANLAGFMDVDFADVDNNGFLDLVFIGNNFPNAIYLANENGVISTAPSWESSETITYNNSLDIGFFGENKTPGFVTTGNNQLGGDGKIRFYDFTTGVPVNSFAAWVSPDVGYGSGVMLADVDKDSFIDLIYGGWWHPLEIIRGTGAGFENTVAFSSSASSVVETIQMADLGREAIVPMIEVITGVEPNTHAIRLKHQLIESINNIIINGNILSPQDYCFVPNKNWISFSNSLFASDEIIVEYFVSSEPDIVVTNWDGSKGNYIFYNTNISTGSDNDIGLKKFEMLISPNPSSGKISVHFQNYLMQLVSLEVCDLLGRPVSILCENVILSDQKSLNFDVSTLEDGVYLLVANFGNKLTFPQKLVIRK